MKCGKVRECVCSATLMVMNLRNWHARDRTAFAAMNADPEVMRHFPSVLSREESDAMFDRIRSLLDARGYGFLVVADPGSNEFAGFCGLNLVEFPAHFTPCIEIGWRMRREFQGRGWATAAARQVLRAAYCEHGFQEIVAFTVPANLASRRVMEKIGMVHDEQGTFEHPKLPVGHLLRRHVLYRISRGQWEKTQKPKPNETP